jgi:pyruvate-formate lyase-activating enzyme
MKHFVPNLLYADEQGNIFDEPHLKMLCRQGNDLALPRPDELIPLPPESELYLLPGRKAMGFDQQTGRVEVIDGIAVAAFVCPGYTLCGLSAYFAEANAPRLPLFAYGAVGYFDGKFWVAAKKIDKDRRQIFAHIPQKKINIGAHNLLKKYPKNRLVKHLARCALTYCCPAAKNLALGRFEAPLPTSRTCNARCVGCISLQPKDSGFPSTQNRISFTPTVKEITQIMFEHNCKEKRPIYSFGQGCEGEPLTEARLIASAILTFRSKGGKGTININTNASLPDTIEPLARAGLTSIRVSLNSADKVRYASYYRPQNYSFEQVVSSILEAKKNNIFVSLNYLFFPGINDTEEEVESLIGLIEQTKLDFIQMRNLNIDPDLYLTLFDTDLGPRLGLKNFLKRIKKSCPWINFGYFNPYLGD